MCCGLVAWRVGFVVFSTPFNHGAAFPSQTCYGDSLVLAISKSAPFSQAGPKTYKDMTALPNPTVFDSRLRNRHEQRSLYARKAANEDPHELCQHLQHKFPTKTQPLPLLLEVPYAGNTTIPCPARGAARNCRGRNYISASPTQLPETVTCLTYKPTVKKYLSVICIDFVYIYIYVYTP